VADRRRRHFDDIIELLEEPLPSYFTDETRRDLWHADVPGRSTDEKVRYLLDYYAYARSLADAMTYSDQGRSDRELVRRALGQPSDEAHRVDRPGQRTVDVEAMPPEAPGDVGGVAFTARCACTHCGGEGYPFTEIRVTPDGWESLKQIRCPGCGKTDGIVVLLGTRVRGLGL
jgi:hypothetical protein